MEVILLVGLAVGVDYSLFYMRRERESAPRAAARALLSRLPPRPPAMPVLVSGITVLIAMAGMFLSGTRRSCPSRSAQCSSSSSR